MATALPLEGDGLVENLYQYLWSADNLGGDVQVPVPQTVIYRGSQPMAWYFTSRKCGRIKRKTREHLNSTLIEQSFTKMKASTEIVAYYLCQSDSESISPAIEYFDAEALHVFLFKRQKNSHASTSTSHRSAGILQQFLVPKGGHHSTLKAIWSPKLCLLERRENVHTLHDARFNVYERGVTFEEGGGVDSLSRPDPVRGSILPGMVQQLCERVVDYVSRVSYHKYRIARMVLRLQLDADDRLWLLWCSSMRLQSPLTAVASASAINIRPLDIVSDAKVSSLTFAQAFDNRSRFRSSAKFLEANDELCSGQSRCASCAQVVAQRALFPTTYRAVLAHFQYVLKFSDQCIDGDKRTSLEWPPNEQVVQQAGGVGFGICHHLKMTKSNNSVPGLTKVRRGGKQWQKRELIIPPVIRYIHPALLPEDYARLRQDPIFLHKTVGVCEHCCLVYADYTTASLEANALGARTSASAPACLRPVREKPKQIDYLDECSTELRLQTNSLGDSLTRKPHDRPPPIKPTALKPEGRFLTLQTGPRRILHSLPVTPQLPPRINAIQPSDSYAPGIPLSLYDDKCPQLQQKGAFIRERDQHNNATKAGGYSLGHMLDRLSKAKALRRLTSLGNSTQFRQNHSASAFADAIAGAKLEKNTEKSPYSIVQKIIGENGQSRRSSRNFVPQNGSVIKLPVKISVNGETKPVDLKYTHGKCLAVSKKRRFVSSREIQAAAEHRGFLEAALLNAQVQLNQIELSATLIKTTPIVEVEMPKDSKEAGKLRNRKQHTKNRLAGPYLRDNVVDSGEKEPEEPEQSKINDNVTNQND
ncbi:uncharacterized protein PHALS_04052 [Plasmopara halstedii]|uniref:Uncharacterized protein n=1 Tax=Plasmopara halstedii TaxID=4781 RepID=A0A0P1A8Z9_PLAHL|nr:uncharacterized protein PHALS_04052 [Plasmopara halstedii]CEG36793.1 hypothetical protein PHALS_04052 [Plasmopara halstedii]|eukprot:XP_024573162.1 hypothetical protein PHALS_04052 [Plasmopara halstedii]